MSKERCEQNHEAEVGQGKHTRNGDVSRRDFLKKGGLSAAGLTAATVLGKDVAAQPLEVPGSKPGDLLESGPTVPAAFHDLRRNPLPDVDWPLTGAQVFGKLCKEENVAGLFTCPGNYTVMHAIAEEGIPCWGGRDERSTAHAADAYARCTGEVTACNGTEGPGFTNMITAMGSANAARTPLLVLASNMSLAEEDTEARLQNSSPYQQWTSEGMKKYGKRLIDPNRVWEYAGYAFRNLKTGEPGPVHLDFVAEVHAAWFDGPENLVRNWNKARYRTEHKPHPSPQAIAEAVDLIRQAERPIVVASTGVFYHKAWEALWQFAERAEIPMVSTGPSMGHVPADHRLSACAAPGAFPSADLIIYVGQYNMPPAGTPGGFAFSPDAKIIQIEPVPEKIGRNVPASVGIVSDERLALEALADAVPRMTHPAWIAEIEAARAEFEEENASYYSRYRDFEEAVHPAVIAHDLAEFLYRSDIPKEQTTVASGGFGIARYTRRWLRAYRPGQIVNGAYHFAAIGPDIAFGLGVGAAVKEGVGLQSVVQGAPVVAITGDGGFGFSGFEVETQAKYSLPVINIVYNNNAWGTFRAEADNPTTLHMHLFQENLRYDRLGEALGAHGEYVTGASEFLPALERAYQVAVNESRPSVINCQGRKEFWFANQYQPGFLGKVEPGVMAYYH